MKKIQLNGVTLAYTRRGHGTPLLLIHGFPLDHRIWDDVAALLENDFDVILPDLRGFGESSMGDAPYSMDDFARDLTGLLDSLGIEKAVVAGHSMGGYVALAFARLYPERTLGLGMVASQALADAPEKRQGRYQLASRVADEGAEILAEGMAVNLTPEARLQFWLRDMIQMQSSVGVIGALKAMADRIDSTFLLPAFKFPVAIVHGDADIMIPVERGREMKSAMPHAHYVELAAIGHMPMAENAQETAEALRSLLPQNAKGDKK